MARMLTEAGLNRLFSIVTGREAFAILSCFKRLDTGRKNKTMNQHLGKYLISNRIGYHELTGVWHYPVEPWVWGKVSNTITNTDTDETITIDTKNDGTGEMTVPEAVSKGYLKPEVEDSLLAIKPTDMDFNHFNQIILRVALEGGCKQEAYIISDGKTVKVVSLDGTTVFKAREFGKSAYATGLGYSVMRGRPDVPFRFTEALYREQSNADALFIYHLVKGLENGTN